MTPSDFTTTDLIAQSMVFAFLLLALRHRRLLEDMTDGNVCRLEREEAEAAEASWWLRAMELGRVPEGGGAA
jgi:hypothetical protein